MKVTSVVFGFALAAALAMSAAHAQSQTADGVKPQTFVTKAGQDGMTEVALAKLALEKSKNEKVRDFADRMVKDHGKANAELTGIAGKKGYTTPKQLDAEHQAMVAELKGRSGTTFDAAYSQHMQMAHDKAIALFEVGSTSSDADVAAFAQKTLPTLKEHKQMADTLN